MGSSFGTLGGSWVMLGTWFFESTQSSFLPAWNPPPPPVFCLNPSHFSRYNILAALGIKPQTTNSGGLLNAPVRLFGNRWKYRRSSNVHGLSDDLMNTNIAGTCRNLDVCRKGISTAQPFPTVDLLPIRVEFFFKGYKVWRSLWSSSWTTCHSQGSFHLRICPSLWC